MYKEEYKDYPLESNQEIYLTSSWFKNHYCYEMFEDYLEKSLRDNSKHCVFNFNYLLSVEHRLLSKERAEAMKSELDSISWDMEMESLFYGENESAFYKSTDINPCRTLIKPWYPPTDVEWIENRDKKKNSFSLPKVEGEIRILSSDIALSKGASNDNSVYTLFRLIPDNKGYKRQVVHIESWNGVVSEKQSIRIKQLFFDFEVDRVILDSAGGLRHFI